MFNLIVHFMLAFYLIAGGLVIDAKSNLASKLIFKVVPVGFGMLLAFEVYSQIKGI